MNDKDKRSKQNLIVNGLPGIIMTMSCTKYSYKLLLGSQNRYQNKLNNEGNKKENIQIPSKCLPPLDFYATYMDYTF